MNPVTLEGAVVRLEPLAPAHVEGLAAAGLDPELWRVTTTCLTSIEDVRAYVDAALADADSGYALPFCTIHRPSGAIVGSTRFGNYDAANRRVEIGWTWIARPWQRTAVNTEAKYLMLRHAFEALGAIRVELKTDLLNTPSQRAIARIGATREGVLRSHMIVRGGRVRDTVYFSIIAPEWPAVKTSLERMLAR
ncbi:MAG TPA: GNAT family protein [Vicinamibacterales bacterium]|nr:GNAT family protein [Vicinamibacterales bacterium]